MAIRWSDVIAIYPGVKSTPSEGQAAIIAITHDMVPESAWPANLYRLGAVSFAAHLAEQAKRSESGQSGPVVSESVGGVSISYGVASGMTSFSATAYGQEYLRLATLAGLGGFTLGQCSWPNA